MRFDEPTPAAPAGIEKYTADDLEHWQVRMAENGNLWLLLDQQDGDGEPTTVNTISRAVLEELDRLLNMVSELAPRTLVIRSLKPAGFSVGADIRELRDETEPERLRVLLETSGDVVGRLADLDVPTVAVLHGHCLGAGLELALACRYRIARSDTGLGFPEVQLGLHPGLGGTARLSHLIEPSRALTLMLTGKPVSADEALEQGLVDVVTEERHLLAAVEDAAGGALSEARQSVREKAMTLRGPRQLIVRQAQARLEKRTRADHYPAPFALLELWGDSGGSIDEMLQAERTSFIDLLSGTTARNLIRVYFLRERLREAGKARASGIGSVHVVGAGTMGGDIAAWCASQGMMVSLEDRSAEFIGPAMRAADRLFARQYDDPRDDRDAWDRLVPDPAGHGRRRADLIIEAVPEKLDLKRQVLAEVEADMKEDALLATNTSSLPLEDLAEAVTRPGKLAGLHFFNPVARMQLVEVVRHDAAAPDLTERLAAFAVDIDRLPVAVASTPGFLVNRVLTPYLLEALTLVDEGVPKALVDTVAEDFGMPMGPIELADSIGLDICVDVADSLIDRLPGALPPVPGWLRDMVAREELGQKSGKGLYTYGDDGEAQKDEVGHGTDEALSDRLMLPLVVNAVDCLEDGVVADADLLDGALVFGAGFAPFRGGPVHYLRTRGADEISRALGSLAERHGDRFRRDAGWASRVGTR